jgi:UDP-GlcNAc3NAcA epimerase
MMKILTVVGARPQFIKAATVSRALRRQRGIREILLHTGQHYDANMSEVFFRELDIPEPDYNLEVGSGSHAWQTARMLKGIEEVLLREKPGRTLVYGDTNSTLAGALAAVKLHIPVAHVEAGLRSFNPRMPEEINRIATDRVADLLFAPTRTAIRNLQKEGMRKNTVFSGDVMYDSILFYREKVMKDPGRFSIKGIPQSYCLATVHRAENTDDPRQLKRILRAFSGTRKKIVFPIHPRTRKLIRDTLSVPANLIIINPVGYLEMIHLTLNAEMVLTDSGGLQKEAYFLGKPCITLRGETEWVETLHGGWNTLAGTDPKKIMDAVRQPFPSEKRKNVFGNGHAAELIAQKLS